MDKAPKITLYSYTIDCKEPNELAKFYAALMGWDMKPLDESYACVYAPGTPQFGYPGILFQKNAAYHPPVWPDEPDKQQQMAHIDFAVIDIEKSAIHAISCGARAADHQFADNWRVMIDPEGHPFCLCNMKQVMDSPDFGLL